MARPVPGPVRREKGERVGGRRASRQTHRTHPRPPSFLPSKPKYFNRVHTGYDWTKYARAHYDGDNPPPKSVKGYKFNVFYPDLIDPSIAPTYRVEPDPAAGPQKETVLLRFSAGPPYADVVFRLLNREWDTGRKAGSRSVFERGILQVYFNFKRERYRR